MQDAEKGIKDTPAQDFPHTSTDADINNGITNEHLSESSEQQARRDSLSRKLEEILVDANAWLELSNHPDAISIVNHLEEAYDMLGVAIENSNDVPETEPSPTRGADINEGERASEEEELSEALRDSFPASDPPANY